jgi:hypothetical protein
MIVKLCVLKSKLFFKFQDNLRIVYLLDESLLVLNKHKQAL